MKKRVKGVKKKTKLRKELYRSWWILLFGLLVATMFSQAILPIQKKRRELNALYHSLQEREALLEKRIAYLSKVIENKDDPALIEKKLKETLFVIPENEVKIIFPPEAK